MLTGEMRTFTYAYNQTQSTDVYSLFFIIFFIIYFYFKYKLFIFILFFNVLLPSYVVREDCQARKLNKEDAMDHCKWRKVIKEAR